MDRKLTMKTFVGIVVSACVALFFTTGVALASDDFPTKPINLWVGFKAGGAVDAASRILAKAMANELGQPVIVVNKPGGAGTRVVSELYAAKPDGYTLCMTGDINYTFDCNYFDLVYKSHEPFQFVGTCAQMQWALVCRPDVPWKDFKGFIQYAKKNPVKCGNLAASNGAVLNYIKEKEKLDLRIVLLKGGAVMVPQLLGGHLDMASSGGIHYEYVKAGKMRLMAFWSKKRSPDFPEIPSISEFGYPSIDMNMMLATRRGVPEKAFKKLVDAFRVAVKGPKYVSLMEGKLHFPIGYKDPQQIEKDMVLDTEKFIKVLKTIKAGRFREK